MTIIVVTSARVGGAGVILVMDFVNGAKQIRMLSMILKVFPTTLHNPNYLRLINTIVMFVEIS